MLFISAILSAGITCSGGGAVAVVAIDQRRRANCGSRWPRGAGALAAVGEGRVGRAMSIILTSSAPIGSETVSGSGVVRPILRAVSTILARPSSAMLARW